MTLAADIDWTTLRELQLQSFLSNVTCFLQRADRCR